MLCHGQGDPDFDGCCWVNGEPCPLRWKIVNGHIFNAAGTDLGTVDAYINSVISSKAGRDRAKAQVQGVRIACRAAVEVIVNDSKLLTNRAGFVQAWNTHPDYVALVRPEWERVEDRMGIARGSFQCSTWKGEGGTQCCFAEPQAVNDARAAALAAATVTIRRAGGT